MARVVLHVGIPARELVKWCRARLAPHVVPRRIDILGERPRSPTGKRRRAPAQPILTSPESAARPVPPLGLIDISAEPQGQRRLDVPRRHCLDLISDGSGARTSGGATVFQSAPVISTQPPPVARRTVVTRSTPYRALPNAW
ncbi:hypothetical protein [Lentzea sp. NPDC004782]|uniref:hypothetical protein n=1 Tax=Lentzea sp. NPDC004782 TaxID=3154458 RepID=UPI0033BB2C47